MSSLNKETRAQLAKRVDYRKITDILVFVSLCLFIASPLLQTIREYIAPHTVSETFGHIRTYPFTIGTINYVVLIVSIFLWIRLLLSAMRQVRQGNRPAVFLPLAVFGVLSLWIYVSQAVNGFSSYAYTGDPYRNESLLTFVTYLMGYFFLGTVLKSNRLRKTLCIVFLGSNLVLGILSLIDRFLTNLRVFDDGDGMSAIFHQFNHYGYYLMMAILVSAMLFVVAEESLLLRALCAVVFVVDNVVLILNNTFGCYLAVIMALLFGGAVIAVFRRKRWECIRMVIVLITFVVISFAMHLMGFNIKGNVSRMVRDVGRITANDEKAASAGTGRWALWKHTVDYISEKPVFGWGVDGTTKRLGEEADTINDRPHNEYLQWAAFFGIPAAALYFAALCIIMFGMFPRIAGADGESIACFVASAGYIASAFVGNTMYYTTPFFFIFLGMTCRDRFYRKKETEQEQIA